MTDVLPSCQPDADSTQERDGAVVSPIRERPVSISPPPQHSVFQRFQPIPSYYLDASREHTEQELQLAAEVQLMKITDSLESLYLVEKTILEKIMGSVRRRLTVLRSRVIATENADF
jgi:hypothetical protein